MKRAGISLLMLAASAAMFTTAQAATLFDNSNITTGVGNGANGANTSAIATNSTSYGLTSNSVPSSGLTYQLAEDFSVANLSTVSSIVFDAYSTSTYPANPTSPFTGATVNIWSAQPGTTGAVVLFSSTTLAATAWTGVYRVQTTTLTNAQRPVFSLSVSFANVPLVAGTYWASFDVTGITSPGVATSVFTPPVMNTDGTMPAGNGIQSADGGSTWVAVADTTYGSTNRFPLTVNGTAVPEPATVTLTVLGGIGLVAAARRRAQAGV